MVNQNETQADTYLKSGSNELKILEFNSSTETYGINILKVSRVLDEMESFCIMPEMHPCVRGVFTDHGQMVPVLDLNLFFNNQETSLDEPYRIIVTEFFGVKNALLVNHVESVHTVLWEQVINAQNVIDQSINPYVISIVQPQEDKMIMLLDYETIIMKLTPQDISSEVDPVKKENYDGKNLNILIAEDSSSIRDMLQVEMEDRGFIPIMAHDGQEALEKLEEHDDIALIVSDVEMPRIDGLALTKRVKENPKTNGIPVIVYSSIGDVGMKERAKFLKAEEHITKLNLDELFERISSLLNL